MLTFDRKGRHDATDRLRPLLRPTKRGVRDSRDPSQHRLTAPGELRGFAAQRPPVGARISRCSSRSSPSSSPPARGGATPRPDRPARRHQLDHPGRDRHARPVDRREPVRGRGHVPADAHRRRGHERHDRRGAGEDRLADAGRDRDPVRARRRRPDRRQGQDFFLYPPAASAIPDVQAFDGTRVKVDVEKIVQLGADLVFAGGNFGTPPDDDRAAPGSACRSSSSTPRRSRSVLDDIALTGDAVGKPAEADALVDEMQAGFDAVSASVDGPAPKPRVFYETRRDRRDLRHRRRIVPRRDDPARRRRARHDRLEGQVRDARSSGSSPRTPSSSSSRDRPYGVTQGPVAERPGWNVMTAVKNGDIRPIDDQTVTRPGPRLIARPPAARRRRSIPDAPVPSLVSDSAWGLMGGWPPAAARSSPPDSTSGGPGVSAAGRSCWRWSGSSRSWARSSWASAWGRSRSRPATRSRSSPTACSGWTSARPGRPRPRRSSGTCACRGSSTAMVVGTGAGGRGRDVPGPAPQSARRSVRAGHGVRGGPRGGDRGAHPDPRRVPRVRAAPGPGVRRRAARDARRLPAVAAGRPLADDEPAADRLRASGRCWPPGWRWRCTCPARPSARSSPTCSAASTAPRGSCSPGPSRSSSIGSALIAGPGPGAQRAAARRGGGEPPRRRRPTGAGDPPRPGVARDGGGGRDQRADRLRRARRAARRPAARRPERPARPAAVGAVRRGAADATPTSSPGSSATSRSGS